MSEPPIAAIERLRIFQVRAQSVVLDSDLAALYGVATGAFNQAIKRNLTRFPGDFSFRVSAAEFGALMSQIVISKGRGGRRKLPRVFTEHGAIMAATILNSPRAVALSVFVVRAFVRLRNELLANATLEKRLVLIEKTLLAHDVALRIDGANSAPAPATASSAKTADRLPRGRLAMTSFQFVLAEPAQREVRYVRLGAAPELASEPALPADEYAY